MKNLKRRLLKLKERQKLLEVDHKGNEQKYTYWAGYEMGYTKGRISEIEDIIDEKGI